MVIRPSGKMTHLRSAWTARISALVAIGLVGSMVIASTSQKIGRAHHLRAMKVLIGKVGLPGRKTVAIAAATMKSAFQILLAAMIRERWLSSLRACRKV